MRKDYPRYTLRVSKEVLYKMKYIAEFNGRTKNKQIEQIIKKYINNFETEYGDIALPPDIEEDE